MEGKLKDIFCASRGNVWSGVLSRTLKKVLSYEALQIHGFILTIYIETLHVYLYTITNCALLFFQYCARLYILSVSKIFSQLHECLFH